MDEIAKKLLCIKLQKLVEEGGYSSDRLYVLLCIKKRLLDELAVDIMDGRCKDIDDIIKVIDLVGDYMETMLWPSDGDNDYLKYLIHLQQKKLEV